MILLANTSLFQSLLSWWTGHRWSPFWFYALWGLVVCAIVLVFLLLTVMYLIWMERKVAGDIQSRLGPMRVGKFGVLQSVADVVKLLLKEDIIPQQADRMLFVLAPVLVFLPAFLTYAVLPFARTWVPSNLDVGVLYVIAISNLPVLGVLMAGWASNNKWALLGGMRAAAQFVSYEVPLVLAVLTVAALTGSFSLVRIVESQSVWLAFSNPMGFIAFLLYFTAAMAEVNRNPFDLPEAESELVAGYHTEYSGMRWAFFMLGEYISLFFVCGFAATLFLGGWHGPVLPPVIWFLIKTYALIFLAMWLKWTLPRLRVDQLMRFGWKVLLPVSLANLLATAFWVVR